MPALCFLLCIAAFALRPALLLQPPVPALTRLILSPAFLPNLPQGEPLQHTQVREEAAAEAEEPAAPAPSEQSATGTQVGTLWLAWHGVVMRSCLGWRILLQPC